ncbi:MAG: dihydrolipoyllysine-residue acetyltransferase [Gammaproteobacteria bacterium TMED57]|nr:MAG: dihydrolipoyllysine-residue acetyltransferase [Gammaproteobacteria bacterium TMED57]
MNIVLPSLGDIEEVEVTEICVAVSDVVGADDPIIVIESDKASMEVPAGNAGTIVEISVALGDQLGEGAIIGTLDTASIQGADSAAAGEPTSQQSDDTGNPSAAKGSEPSEQARSGGQQVVQISVPDLGDIEEVEVIEVAATAGSQVAPGDLLVVLESDKASMEIPAEVTGVLLEVNVAAGDQVSAGSLLATARIEGSLQDDAMAMDGPSQEGETLTAAPSQPAAAMPEPAPEDKMVRAAAAGRQVYAGPATRRLAREIGVPLEQVEGSGNRGRVTKDDVKAWAKARINQPVTTSAPVNSTIPPVPVVDFAKFGDVEEQPLSRIQKQVALNMQRSWLNIPHVTQHANADIEDLESFRQSIKAEAQNQGIRLSPLPFIIKAVCQTLAAHPKLNGSLSPDGENLVVKHYTNIGIAVDTPDGLVVPVIRGADQLGILALAGKAQELAEKARSKKLALDDLSGGTFTISSLGNIGGTGFTPIINAPEVAILGVGKSVIQPIWQGGAFEPRLQLPLSLSYDHRVINGVDGGNFMATLTALLADIRRLAL